MGGFFGVASKEDCVFDLFFGTDYHSHLGTRRAGMSIWSRENGFERAIHNIENAPFRTKFDKDVNEMMGTMGIGSISDYEPQPLLVRSHHDTYSIVTVGRINNTEELVMNIFRSGHTHFLEMSGGEINATELVAALINSCDNLIDGLRYALDVIDGSMSIMLLTAKGIYAARDKYGRTPVVIGRKESAFCVSLESFAYLNLGFTDYKALGPGEIDIITPEGVQVLSAPGKKLKICTFLWVYYGYPSSTYENVNVEDMRNRCGVALARRDKADPSFVKPHVVAGVPDSGTAHAIGYANESGIPFSRPFIKYTPTWPRSFMPTIQSQRDLIARMKLIPIRELIDNRRLLLIDDSIVRGTQLRETTEYLFNNGAREVHVRPACPPVMFSCRYLNFSRSTSPMDLITRRMIQRLAGDDPDLSLFYNPDTPEYQAMLDEIRKQNHFTTLRYQRLDDMLQAVGIDPDRLCTYCWNGRE
ncbi:MAG: amidophosphoribosyltransferase [Firmicutes bacterium]|nr:amidophosphoribosyltransferase [Bacillota bacterium]